MAIIADMHTHSGFSEDVEMRDDTTISYIAKAAKKNGVDILAVTDHYDLDLIVRGITSFDDKNHTKEMLEEKEKSTFFCNDYPELLYGIELGECDQYPEMAEKFVNDHPFDYVLGSLHTLKGKVDFWIWDYNALSETELVEAYHAYLDELIVMVRDYSHLFDSMAHITYPLRYYKKFGRKAADEKIYAEHIDELLSLLIKKDKPLEINTSGLRQGIGRTLPSFDIAARYFELGGRLITVGSDAHIYSDFGADIENTYKELAKIGFTSTVIFRARKGIELSIV